MVILGFGVLLIPSIASEPNLRGLPTIPLALFISALVLYAAFENRRLMLYAMLILLLPTLGYSGLWAYSYKMPLSSLEISMRIHHVYVGPAYGNTMNMSLIESSMTVLNPSNVDTPPFALEKLAVYINDMKLADGYAFDFGHMVTLNGEPIFLPFTVIKAHESLNITRAEVSIYQDRLQVEKGSPEDTWNVLSSRDFMLKITGAFTSRPDYETEVRMFNLWILATSPFQMSEKFSES
jgi:hypothetical protein